MVDWTLIRDKMAIVKTITYLNHAAVAPLPISTKNVWQKVVDDQELGDTTLDLKAIHEGYPDVRKEIGTLIHAHPDDIALTVSAAHGISTALTSLDWHEDLNKGIILNDLEYTSNSFAYQQIAKRYHVPLHVIKSKTKNNYVYPSLEDYEEILREHPIRIIGISHVQFINGYQTDLQKLSSLAHKYGALVLVDGIQSVGAIDLDVQKTNVDFVAVGGYKWCLGPLSTGFLYVRKDLIEKTEPLVVGAFSDQDPFNFQHHIFHPYTNARRFQAIGAPQIVGLGESIHLLNQFGIENIQHRIFELLDYFIEQLHTHLANIHLESSLERNERSGILRLKLPEGIDLEQLPKTLNQKYKISASVRLGGLRISPHAYNTEEDLDYLIKSLKDFI